MTAVNYDRSLILNSVTILGQCQHAFHLFLPWSDSHRWSALVSARFKPQDDKKSSIASESHQDEDGGRRDSFDSEDMPIDPIENQTVYAKSNILKGE